MLSMLLRSFGGMMVRVMKMTLSGVSVMCGLLVVRTFVLLGRFLMVVRGVHRVLTGVEAVDS